MRTTLDAMRSLRQYVAGVLGEPWEVRLWADDGTFALPFCRVAKSAPTLYTSRRVYTDIVQATQIHCWPEPGATVDESLVLAESVQEALTFGIETGRPPLGWPRRVPLFDFAGVPLGEVATKRGENDYLRVEDFQVNTLHDTIDDRRVTVVADVRMRWRKPTTLDVVRPTVDSVGLEQVAS